MQLIIFHYHLRPGGIRRVIELGTPHLVRQLPRVRWRIVLATGEGPESAWLKLFRERLAGTPVEVFLDPAFKYSSEQKRGRALITRRVRVALARLLDGRTAADCLVWAHNLGIARNLVLSRELAQACRTRDLPLLAHHHDWWFDNRWLRWPEMRRLGFRTPQASAHAVFPLSNRVRHLAINQADTRILRRHLGDQAGWLPNLMEPMPVPPPERLRAARRWLRASLQDRERPVWLLPCRLLRRKNVAEALLLTRWLRPEAWLVTTGSLSSNDEKPYHDRVTAIARQQNWRLRLGVFQKTRTFGPTLPDLLAASEVLLLTSIQEGFGLPYLEAAAARRPLIARQLPNIAPDLKKFGLRFPQYYSEILVDPSLFNWDAEWRRQQDLFASWKQRLPKAGRTWVGTPALLAVGNRPQPVPFSRLTLTAQLEVLAQPLDRSWDRCAPLNPFLPVWQDRARRRRLQITPWPVRANTWLSGPAYARRFFRFARFGASPPLKAPPDTLAIQEDFMRNRLTSAHLFPLLWASQT